MLLKAALALTWIFPNLGPTWPREAGAVCAAKQARVPYAIELVVAAQAGVNAGGVPPLEEDQIYLVADQQRTTDDYFYFGAALTGADPRGPVRSGAGFGPIRSYFYCVQGEPSAFVKAQDSLYRLHRRITSERPAKRAELVTAVEYLLNRLGAFGAREAYRNSFTATAPALSMLARSGYPVDNDTVAQLPR